MSSTPAQISRYPRPLKATHSFQQQQTSPGTPSPYHTFSSLSYSQKEPSPGRNDGMLGARISPYSESHQHVMATDDSLETGGNDHRIMTLAASDLLASKRSNSLNSLSDSDLTVRTPVGVYTHRRSNSLSNSQGSYEARTPRVQQIHPQEAAVYSRFSVEGLNQEISSALEGKSLAFQFSHPDGHIAPVNDINKGGVTRITVTTPINVYSSPPLTPSSPTYSSDELSSSTSSLCLHHSSNPVVIDVHSSIQYPSSPKPSFDHRPPDNAERVNSKMSYSDNYIPKAPDRSKANIVFNGSVFSPPLFPSPHSIEALTIS